MLIHQLMPVIILSRSPLRMSDIASCFISSNRRSSNPRDSISANSVSVGSFVENHKAVRTSEDSVMFVVVLLQNGVITVHSTLPLFIDGICRGLTALTKLCEESSTISI